MLYAIIGEDAPGSLERRRAARPAHLERVRQLQDEGRVVVAGPLPAIDSPEPGFHTEYANSGNSWATIIGRIIAAPYSGVRAYVYLDIYDFQDVEVGTTSLNGEIIIANFGDADLVITDIPSSFDDFNLVSSLSFPLTIASYDSLTLEFNYSPTSAGAVNLVYPVTSNDPGLTGIQLSGSGYDLALVTE